MAVVPLLTFSSPILGSVAVALALATVGIAIYRQITPPRRPAIFILIGLLFLCAAAAQPIWHHTRRGSVAVMVDLSPSTRGAHYRDSDFLRARVTQLLGNTSHQSIAFASQNERLDLNGPLAEIPADETNFTPANADAIVLFSDAQFELPPKSPPVYVVADENLEHPDDASIENLDARGQSIAATVANTGAARTAAFSDVSAPIEPGSFVLTHPKPAEGAVASAKLNPADAWPENDSLSLKISAPPASQKWWIGQNAPGNDWHLFSPSALPTESSQYLAPSIISIDNQSADAFSPTGLNRLAQYVRDLGGSLVIFGGDRAYAAGGYAGTAFDQLSPLSSFPPKPTRRWILLVDGSGSMNQSPTPGAPTRWQSATDAVIQLIPRLPQSDVVQIGQFSDDLHWWFPAQAVADAAAIPLPPAGALPHGPTNLEPALRKVADETDGLLPTDLLLISDCDAELDYPDELALRFQEKNIHLDLLAIEQGSGLAVIKKIILATHGNAFEQFDPRKWTDTLRELYQTALPSMLVQHSIGMLFLDRLKALPVQSVSVWNRTWQRQGSDLAAQTLSAPTSPSGAFWHVGLGSVLALAFPPDPTNVDSLASAVAARPRDPRFTVSWENDRHHRVVVDAAEDRRPLNNLIIWLSTEGDLPGQSIQLIQTEPGRYEAPIEPAADSRIALLKIGDEIVDRSLLSARYPREFDAIGNNHDAMQKLADLSGGKIISPDDHNPIDFHWPTVATAFAPWLCFLGLIALATGIVLWRLRRPDAY